MIPVDHCKKANPEDHKNKNYKKTVLCTLNNNHFKFQLKMRYHLNFWPHMVA